ncbi:Domain of uncharacterised function (DUF2828) [Mycobacteroides abscessus subsp. abscessus]|nr:Domain of uncharacterised function (DUF2828) [Mycobacteroides abscessus subsp. abscessus]
MTALLEQLQIATRSARGFTANGAATNTTSSDPVVDFFGLAGAMRDRPGQAVGLFNKAFTVDPLAAVRTMFYLRDIRGGQGERDVFRAILKNLYELQRYRFLQVVKYVPEYGRWDDLFFLGAEIPEGVGELVKEQWAKDMASAEREGKVSLMAKWLPSTRAKRAEDRQLAKNLQHLLGINQQKYRKGLSLMRGQIDLLETYMSKGAWSWLDFSKLPAQAHMRHTKAFRRNTPERYQKYLDSVTRGEAKINTSTLYPYELYDRAKMGERAVDVMWDNLPDYTQGNDALVMVDVSGSMCGRPMSVSVSLGLYFAERNKGPFKGYFMTFSEEPKLVQVQGTSLSQKIAYMERSTWGYNTNLVRALQTLLVAGARAGSVPSTLYIISDMEFDKAMNVPHGYTASTIFETARRDFRRHGLELPHIVFWNVNASGDNVPALAHDGNVTLVSGLSASTFSLVVEGKTPRALVDDVLNSDRYSRITF